MKAWKRGTYTTVCMLLMTTDLSALEQLYYFTDDRGVPHYSNVPIDPRYKPLPLALSRSPATSTDRPVAEPPTVLSWPPEQPSQEIDESPEDSPKKPSDMTPK